MKRLLLGLALIFFITSNAWSFDKSEFDPLKYQLGMTYDEVKERGKKDRLFFRDFSATSQTLEETDTYVSVKFCEGSNYDGKLFWIESCLIWDIEESIKYLLKYRDVVLEMTGGVEKVVKINKEAQEYESMPGIVVTHELSNGETWELTNHVSDDTSGMLCLLRENLSVCE